jgi:CheY-like chemotaxis protein
VQASDADEALVRLGAGQQFSLLVTDYAMPGLTGRDLALQALARLPALKVLIMTGYPDVQGLAGLPPGVAVIMKPFRRAALIAQLSAWFNAAQVRPAGRQLG